MLPYRAGWPKYQHNYAVQDTPSIVSESLSRHSSLTLAGCWILLSWHTAPNVLCSNPWVTTPTLHSSPFNRCACKHIPLSWSLAASPTTFLPISSDISLAVNINLRHRPIKGAALSGLLPPLPVTPSGWLLSEKIIILMLLSVSACHPYSMFKLEPIQTANQQNYWLQLSPMSVMHITLRWTLKKKRKELRSIVSYDNNMIHDLWFAILLCKSILCTIAFDRPH